MGLRTVEIAAETVEIAGEEEAEGDGQQEGDRERQRVEKPGPRWVPGAARGGEAMAGEETAMGREGAMCGGKNRGLGGFGRSGQVPSRACGQ